LQHPEFDALLALYRRLHPAEAPLPVRGVVDSI